MKLRIARKIAKAYRSGERCRWAHGTLQRARCRLVKADRADRKRQPTWWKYVSGSMSVIGAYAMLRGKSAT